MLLDYDDKLLHFGNGKIDMNLPVNTKNYPNVNKKDYIMVWIKSMNMLFSPRFTELSYAKGEEVMPEGCIPWKKGMLFVKDIVDKCKQITKGQRLILFDNDKLEFNANAYSR